MPTLCRKHKCREEQDVRERPFAQQQIFAPAKSAYRTSMYINASAEFTKKTAFFASELGTPKKKFRDEFFPDIESENGQFSLEMRVLWCPSKG